MSLPWLLWRVGIVMAMSVIDMGALHLGLTEQGLYRVNGNTRLINELKNTFDKSEFVCIVFGLHYAQLQW